MFLCVQEACKLLHLDEFKYLLPIGMLMYWNLYGAVCNVSYGTSPESKINESTLRTVVVNHAVAKKAVLTNIWGDQQKLVEGGKIGLVIRRKTTAEGRPGPIEIVPWSQVGATTPPMSFRGYTDEMNRVQKGYFLYVGTCTEIHGLEISERHRRIAVGNIGKTSAEVQNAYGMLPRIMVEWGM